MVTVTWLTLPTGWGGMSRSAGWPFRATEATPFSTPQGFSTVMW